ncbi:MAG: DUF3105 domain-containing protein [Acidimicrobiia bacterium]|nr:DUF3105 domain-containing protein [Acidimicrobiia bacterium]
MSRGGARAAGGRTEEQRAEEAEMQEAASRRIRHMKRFVIGGLVVLSGVVLILLDPPAPGVAAPVVPPSHIATVDQPHGGYTSFPPSSGAHTGGMPQVGLISDAPIEPEAYLHFMEDAGIGLFYDCEDCPDLVDGLSAFVEAERSERLFVAPFDGIRDLEGDPHPIAAVAWGRILYLDALTEPEIAELETFVSIFEGIDHHAG